MRIFIGTDRRQMLAYTVCRSSIEIRLRGRAQIEPLFLDLLPLKRRGLTEFTYSRYLVPWLCGYQGRALFMDADMIAQADMLELDALAANTKCVSVVKSPRRHQWSSLMYFNNEACRALTLELIETGTPQDMSWASDIAALPKEWNHIVGLDAPNPDAKIIHYTKGIPFWPELAKCENADLWHEEMRAALHTVTWRELMGGVKPPEKAAA